MSGSDLTPHHEELIEELIEELAEAGCQLVEEALSDPLTALRVALAYLQLGQPRAAQELLEAAVDRLDPDPPSQYKEAPRDVGSRGASDRLARGGAPDT